MIARRRWRLPAGLAFALLASATGGCLGNPAGTTLCEQVTTRPLRDGERVRGRDPAALLAPYDGSWRGTLAWRNGAATGLTLAVTNDPPSALTAQVCSGVVAVETTRPATAASDDGAVGASWPLTASVSLDTDPIAFFPVTPVMLTGDFQPPITTIVDLALYATVEITLRLDWTMPATGPSGGAIDFKGTLIAGGVDRIELGTIVFQAQ